MNFYNQLLWYKFGIRSISWCGPLTANSNPSSLSEFKILFAVIDLTCSLQSDCPFCEAVTMLRSNCSSLFQDKVSSIGDSKLPVIIPFLSFISILGPLFGVMHIVLYSFEAGVP